MGRTKTAGLRCDPQSGIWRIDKRIRGYGRLYESTGSCDLEEAERYLNRRLEQLRQASVYGVRQKRKWREAATRYLMDFHRPSLTACCVLTPRGPRAMGTSRSGPTPGIS